MGSSGGCYVSGKSVGRLDVGEITSWWFSGVSKWKIDQNDNAALSISTEVGSHELEVFETD